MWSGVIAGGETRALKDLLEVRAPAACRNGVARRGPWDGRLRPMQSKATTVEAYLKELPPDRREAIEAVRKVFLDNIDQDIEEGIHYGMISYFIPHRVFPAGYHCDPRMPVGYGGIASQKQHMSLYLMSVYGDGAAGGPENEHGRWFKQAWLKTGKKLDMGKCCVRFKRIEDVALDVLAESIRRVPSKVYLASYVRILEQNKAAAAARSAARKAAGGSLKAKAARSSAKGAAMSRKASSLGTAGSTAGGAAPAGPRGTGAGNAKKSAKLGGPGQMPLKQSGPTKPAGKAGGNQVRKTSKSRSR